MVGEKRRGLESSETRAQLIEAASQLVREEGCSAVTARRLADKIGLKRHIIHYYFGTIEELLIAVIHRDGERVRERLTQALKSDEPLRMNWEMANKDSATILEFTALAIRHKAIQAEVKRYTTEFRKMQTQALTRHLKLRGIETVIPPIATMIVLTSISQALAVEKSLGISEGHAETNKLIESWLKAFVDSGELFRPKTSSVASKKNVATKRKASKKRA